MSEIYSDDNGARVIVRHKGPAGRGFPAGGGPGQLLSKLSYSDYATEWVNPPDGTDAVSGPASAVNNRVAVFDGTTGKLLKDGGQPLSNYASISLVDTKQDTEEGKGLSQENFTTILKNKLDGITQSYRGTYASTSLVVSEVADPIPGDYALVEVIGEEQTVSFWDETNSQWDHNLSVALDGQEIANVLFDSVDAALWDVDTCRIFTETEKTQLAAIQATFEAINPGDTVRAYGSTNYFNTTGTAVAIPAISDGQTNMVKAAVGTTLGAVEVGFDAGGDISRLRYTGNTTRVFNVTAVLSAAIPVNDTLVVALAKNGSVDITTRVLQKSAVAGAAHNITLSAQVSLALNEYLEVYVGNTVSAVGTTVHALRINASQV
jgi:hypothetical protein